jgi:hypothetical protein
MIRAVVVSTAAAMAVVGLAAAPLAAADPPAAYLIGACYDPSQPVLEKPATIV